MLVLILFCSGHVVVPLVVWWQVVPSSCFVVVVLSTGAAASVHYDMLPMSSTTPRHPWNGLFLSLDACLISDCAAHFRVECHVMTTSICWPTLNFAASSFKTLVLPFASKHAPNL
jgi:hypothetical protein